MAARPVIDIFDEELCKLIELYSGDGMMSAGEIVSVIEFVKIRVINRALEMSKEDDN